MIDSSINAATRISALPEIYDTQDVFTGFIANKRETKNDIALLLNSFLTSKKTKMTLKMCIRILVKWNPLGSLLHKKKSIAYVIICNGL